jgi:hypothetical protein
MLFDLLENLFLPTACNLEKDTLIFAATTPVDVGGDKP